MGACFGSAKAKANLQNSTEVSKIEQNYALQVTDNNRSTIVPDSTVDIPKRGASSTVGVHFIFKDGIFDELWTNANPSKSMSLGDVGSKGLETADCI